MKLKLPEGWEKCRVGIKGVRKWRNMATQCWVRGQPVKIDRTMNSAQQAVDSIHAMTLHQS